eukprot:350600-Chlamydomonas_euryale.AAC.2
MIRGRTARVAQRRTPQNSTACACAQQNTTCAHTCLRGCLDHVLKKCFLRIRRVAQPWDSCSAAAWLLHGCHTAVERLESGCCKSVTGCKIAARSARAYRTVDALGQVLDGRLGAVALDRLGL